MTDWFARPVLHVKDVAASLQFYVDLLGFTSPWHYVEGFRTQVAQVDRQGCALPGCPPHIRNQEELPELPLEQ
jgi:catechol 2,3-dioxygenase-like lactoylglutathione lyase family enzyme